MRSFKIHSETHTYIYIGQLEGTKSELLFLMKKYKKWQKPSWMI